MISCGLNDNMYSHVYLEYDFRDSFPRDILLWPVITPASASYYTCQHSINNTILILVIMHSNIADKFHREKGMASSSVAVLWHYILKVIILFSKSSSMYTAMYAEYFKSSFSFSPVRANVKIVYWTFYTQKEGRRKSQLRTTRGILFLLPQAIRNGFLSDITMGK